MKTFTLSGLIGLLACTLVSTAAFADQRRFAPDDGWSFSASLDSVKFKKDAADREWIGDTAYDFNIAAEHYSRNSPLVLGMGIGFLGYDDNAGFSQQTNQGSKDSSASAMSLFAEIGTRYWFNNRQESFISAHFGVNTLIQSKRAIDYCSNCYSEDINLDGGTYGALRLGHRFNSFDLSLQYQKFFTGDFDSVIGIKIATNF